MRRLATAFAATTALFLFAATSASAAPPKVVATSFSEVTTTSVLLEAEIVPETLPTTYRFEYGTKPCSEVPSPCTATPDGPTLAAGATPVPVEAELEGLSPGTTYFFRAVAQSFEGTDPGPDVKFATYVAPFAGLPDARAYEQASPVEKNAQNAKGRVAWVRASPSGDRVTFMTLSGIPGDEGAQEIPAHLSTRSTADWSTQGLLPKTDLGASSNVIGWLPDFSTSYSASNGLSEARESTLAARSSAGGALSTLVPYGEGLIGTTRPSFVGASPDGSEVYFESTAALASVPSSLAGKPNLYVWDKTTEELSLAGVMNDETAPAKGAFGGPYDWFEGEKPATLARGGGSRGYYTQDLHAVSADGNRAYFTTAGNGQLYLRQNPTEEQSPLDGEECEVQALACTYHVSASKRTIPDPLGPRPAAFQAASQDGSIAYFTSGEKLTDDANTGPEQASPPAIARAEIDGSPSDLTFHPVPPASASTFAVDATHIYWVDPSSDSIMRTELDGTGDDEEFLSAAQAEHPQWIAIFGDQLYWTNTGELDGEGKPQDGKGTIGRAKIGATGAEAVDLDFIESEPFEVEPGVFKDTINNPQGIAVNATHVYWANLGKASGQRRLARAEIDGGGQELFGVDGLSDPFDWKGVALALDATHLYFSSDSGTPNEGFIRHLPLASLNTLPQSLIAETGRIRGLAVDAGHVYWTNSVNDVVGRAKPDGTTPEPTWIAPAGHPKGLALNASHLFWAANQEVPLNPGNDLYRWEANEQELTDLTPLPSTANGAEVRGVLGTSTDGSHLYFVANGDLDGGGPATGGNCKGTGDSFAFSGQCSLYLWRQGPPASIELIARLDTAGGVEGDAINWLPFHGGLTGQLERTARVSPDGQTLLFQSRRQLGDYPNKGIPELYRFVVGEGVSCVSCNPTGEGPEGPPTLMSISTSQQVPQPSASTLSRNLSADGNRVFFESVDTLVVNDTNGATGCSLKSSAVAAFPNCRDVYLWEAKGSGSCTEALQGGGCLYLLSTGQSPEPSFFADASASGNDAFLFTSTPKLVLQDQDQLYDLFDVRVGGGFASQNTPPKEPCEAEGCKGPVVVLPLFQTPSSAVPKKPRRKNKKHHKRKKRNAKRNGNAVAPKEIATARAPRSQFTAMPGY